MSLFHSTSARDFSRNPKRIAIIITVWIFNSAAHAKPEIIIASDGFTNEGLRTEFSIYANSEKGTPKLTLDRNKLPIDIKFIDNSEGEARFIWESPKLGQYTLTIQADDGDDKETIKFPFMVENYDYPKENAGKMIMPEYPPPKGATLIHVSTSGTARNFGTFESPVDIKTALKTARRISSHAIKPIYILFKRGDHWKEKNTFVINKPLKGKKQAPIVFGAYGEGNTPIIDRLFSQTNIEYLHFQDLEFRRVLMLANKVIITDAFIPGTTRRKLTLKERYSVQRIRFHQCTSTGGGFAFHNTYANAGRGSRVPKPNRWNGGGPLAGMIRDIEISHSLFRDTTTGDTPDAINFNGPDRGVWIHHNKFINSKEEHIDIAGGSGHLIEYNFAVGSTTNNGIKFHSQFSILTDAVIQHNTILFAGGWDTFIPGTKGNAFVALNVMGCQIHDNNFISRYSAAIGDDNKTNDRSYYGTLTGNNIRNNVYVGTVQILGQHNQTTSRITERNLFSDNKYSQWPDTKGLIRIWDRGTPNKPKVGTEIHEQNFKKWLDSSVINETIVAGSDLNSIFINPKLPSSPNTPINIEDPGEWERRTPAAMGGHTQ